MRSLLIFCLTMASACASESVSNKPLPTTPSLTIRDSGGKQFAEMDGIWRVDAIRFKAPKTQIYIDKGKHTVGYQCPGTMSMDDFATLEYAFETDKRYELVCEIEGGAVTAVIQILPK